METESAKDATRSLAACAFQLSAPRNNKRARVIFASVFINRNNVTVHACYIQPIVHDVGQDVLLRPETKRLTRRVASFKSVASVANPRLFSDPALFSKGSDVWEQFVLVVVPMARFLLHL